MAILIQHPSSRVTFAPMPVPPRDPREQDVFTPPTTDQCEVLAVQEGLYAAVQKYGAARVSTWLRTMAALAGQGIDNQ